jgi:hypothetical protein
VLRWSGRGCVFLSRAVGTHEGGPFEQAPGITVAFQRGPLIQRCEFFDAADAERALARFEELCADA